MTRFLSCLLFLIIVFTNATSFSSETIVFMRHAERPFLGFGQLTCKGMKRALALPDVLSKHFGKPDYIFAPNPFVKVLDLSGWFYYIRPFASIEPTAISLNLPVNTQYGYFDVDEMADELVKPQYHNATIYVNWEHLNIVYIAKKIMANLNEDFRFIPPWPVDDYDSLYVLKIDWSNEPHVVFKHQRQALNHLTDSCGPSISQVKEISSSKTFILIPTLANSSTAQAGEEGSSLKGQSHEQNCLRFNKAFTLLETLKQTYKSIDSIVIPSFKKNNSVSLDTLMLMEPSAIFYNARIHNRFTLLHAQSVLEKLTEYFQNNRTIALASNVIELKDIALSIYQYYGKDSSKLPAHFDKNTIYEINLIDKDLIFKSYPIKWQDKLNCKLETWS